MKKFLLINIFIMALCYTAFAQDSTKTTVTAAAIFSSNASYYGQTAEKNLPYILGNATVRFPFGINISASSYKLLDSTSGISAAILGAGYDFNITKKVNVSFSYNHTFFPKNSPFIQASNPDNINAGLSYQHWFTTGLSADYAFGKQQDVFLTFSNSKLLNLGSFSDKDLITLEPGIEIVGGTQHFFQTYVTEQKNKNKLIGNLPNPLFPPSQSTTTTTSSSTSLDLMSYNLKLPLSYNRANYVIEASYQLSVLGKNIDSGSKTPKSFFNLGFYYQF